MATNRRPSSMKTARLLISIEQAASTGEQGVEDLLHRLFQRMRAHLGRWVGTDAFDALAIRVVADIARENPLLAGQAWSPSGTDGFPGLRERLMGAPPEVHTAVVELLASGIVETLGTFVGEEIAVALVREAWPEINELEMHERAERQRS